MCLNLFGSYQIQPKYINKIKPPLERVGKNIQYITSAVSKFTTEVILRRVEHTGEAVYLYSLSSLSSGARQPIASITEFFTLLTSKFPVTLIPIIKKRIFRHKSYSNFRTYQRSSTIY